MTTPELIRSTIAQNLHLARITAEIPGLGPDRRGKVRHTYRARDYNGQKVLVISTSDRVSAFDIVLDRAIPFKGAVLNGIAQWAFDTTRDIIPNALLRSPSPHIMIQRELENIGFECVVRGFMWGSLAAEYERGVREKCGLALSQGLWRYQQLDVPIFTPTTKARTGHDRDVTFSEMIRTLDRNLSRRGLGTTGRELAVRVRDISLALYRRGDEQARRAGLIMVDTKYEFGLDREGRLYLIDEIHTPDSSRYVELADWKKKWPLIEELMDTGSWAKVRDLLAIRPELKIRELSKQLVRDVLLKSGYDPAGGGTVTLSDEVIIETAARYIELYERLTGRDFPFQGKSLLMPGMHTAAAEPPIQRDTLK